MQIMSSRTQYDADLRQLQTQMTQMGTAAADAVESAMEALCTADPDMAAAVIKGDQKINQMEQDIQHRCMSLLLRQQPVAGDLRRISAALKAVTDLERMADHAADIAGLAPPVRCASGGGPGGEPCAGNGPQGAQDDPGRSGSAVR